MRVRCVLSRASSISMVGRSGEVSIADVRLSSIILVNLRFDIGSDFRYFDCLYK